MIKQAREQSKESNVEFHEGSAESSPFLKDGEVDMVSWPCTCTGSTQRFDRSFLVRFPNITVIHCVKKL